MISLDDVAHIAAVLSMAFLCGFLMAGACRQADYLHSLLMDDLDEE